MTAHRHRPRPLSPQETVGPPSLADSVSASGIEAAPIPLWQSVKRTAAARTPHAQLRTWLLAAILLFAASTVVAQRAEGERTIIDGVSGEYNLQRCVDVALRYNPSLRAAAASIAEARADVKRAEGLADPTITAVGGVSLYQNNPSFTVPGLGTLTFGRRTNVDAGLQFNWPFYTSGRTDAAEDQARAAVEAATYAELRARQEVALRAVEAYFGVLKAQGYQQVALSQLEALQAQDRAVSKMHEVGLVPRLDALRAHAALAAAEEGLTRANTGLGIATAGLVTVLGIPVDTDITVVEDFAEIELPEELGPAIAEAIEQRPDLHETAAHIKAAEAAYKLAASGRRPVFGLYARADFLRSTILPRTGVLSGGVNFTWPIFDGDQAEAGKDKAAAMREGLEAYRDQLRDQIEFEVTEAFLSHEASPDRVEAAGRGVEAADEGFEASAVGYANQAVPLTDMLDAQADRTRARNDLVTALYDQRLAMARLVHALGR